MAGILFELGIDGRKARAQAEKAGKDIADGVKRGSKDVGTDISKNLNNATSGSKRLAGDLTQLTTASGNATKGLSGFVGMIGTLTTIASGPIGIVTAGIMGIGAAWEHGKKKLAEMDESIKILTDFSFKNLIDRAKELNSQDLKNFRREIAEATKDIDVMTDLFTSKLGEMRKSANEEYNARIASIEFEAKAGNIKPEEEAKRKIAAANQLKIQERAIEDAARGRSINDANAKMKAELDAYRKVQAEKKKGEAEAYNLESLDAEIRSRIKAAGGSIGMSKAYITDLLGQYNAATNALGISSTITGNKSGLSIEDQLSKTTAAGVEIARSKTSGLDSQLEKLKKSIDDLSSVIAKEEGKRIETKRQRSAEDIASIYSGATSLLGTGMKREEALATAESSKNKYYTGGFDQSMARNMADTNKATAENTKQMLEEIRALNKNLQ